MSEFNSKNLFDMIDCGTKWIDTTNLKKFLMNCAFLPNDNLTLAIIRRVDLDSDAKLNYKEFLDAVKPLENMAVFKKPRAKSAIKASRVIQPVMCQTVGREWHKPRSKLYRKPEIASSQQMRQSIDLKASQFAHQTLEVVPENNNSSFFIPANKAHQRTVSRVKSEYVMKSPNIKQKQMQVPNRHRTPKNVQRVRSPARGATIEVNRERSSPIRQTMSKSINVSRTEVTSPK